MENQFIGSYQVVRKIGAGGMAKVYLAVHKDVPNLKVVLKILSDPSLVERFRQEADKLALLDGHPNICQIKHFFSHGEDMVIAMEYIDGTTLDEMIQSRQRLEVSEALKIISDVLDILDFAHQKEIYHRDIKPSNIMVDVTGRVKVIDFGIAKAKTDPNLTTAGFACGTPAYMAPEQFTPNEKTDYCRVDIYAVGTTLFYMLTGQMPFDGDNEFALRDAKLFNDPLKPRLLNSEVSKPLEEIILRAIEREPESRFHSASEMRHVVEEFRRNATSFAVDKGKPGAAEPDPKKTSNKMTLIVAVLAGLAAVIIGGYFLFFSRGAIDKKQFPPVTQPIPSKDTVVSAAALQSVQNISGLIAMTVTPRGDLYINGNRVASQITERAITLDSGKYALEIRNSKALKKILYDTLFLRPGDTLKRSYSFQMPETKSAPVETPPEVAQGTAIIGSTPRGAHIIIDDVFQDKRQTPYSFKLNPGKHLVTLKINLDGKELERDTAVTVGAGETAKININFEE
jgi:serine/threonine protein kinase